MVVTVTVTVTVTVAVACRCAAVRNCWVPSIWFLPKLRFRTPICSGAICRACISWHKRIGKDAQPWLD